MKNRILVIVFLLTLSTGFSQNKEDRNGNLIGYLEKSDLLSGKYKGWFTHENYKNYEPKTKTLKRIKKSLDGISVKAFVGTWCHDSKREIPRFYKIMEAVDFDLKKNFQIIGITRGKKTPDNLQKGYNIVRTPTIIFFKNGKEIGRFVEHPRKSLEKDILQILKQKNYKHSYEK